MKNSGGRKWRYMQISEEIYQALVIKELKHEAKISDRQIKLMEWQQLGQHRTLKTRRNREVILSSELFNAIASLPVNGRRVFKIESTSPLEAELPDTPERKEAPASDEKMVLARLIVEKLLA